MVITKWRGFTIATIIMLVVLSAASAGEDQDDQQEEPRTTRDVETLGEKVTKGRISEREPFPGMPSQRVDMRTPGPLGALSRKAGVDVKVTGVTYEERPWWRRDWFEVRMSGEGTFARSFSPSNRFSAHRGAGYRLTPGFEITPPEPLLRYESGPWAFYGGGSLSAFYSDNIFLEEDDTDSDIIKLGRPRAGVEWVQPNYSIGVHYSSTFRHSRFENMRLDDHQVGVSSNFRIRESLTGLFKHVSGWRTVLPSDEDSDGARFFDNTTILGLGYKPWEDWEVNVGYDRYQADFNDREEDDVIVNAFDMTLSRRVAPAIWGFGHARFEDTNNADLGTVNTDNHTYYLSTGARFDPLTPFVGIMHVGITHKDFHDSRVSDETAPFLDGRLSYAPRDWMRLYWTIGNRLHETSVVSSNAPDGAAFKRFTTSAGATFEVAERWGFGTKAFYIADDYSGTSDREDDLYGGRVSLHYRINTWATAVLSYQYQRNDSNVSGEDFTENFVSGGLDVSF